MHPWRIRMLGCLSAGRPGITVDRFRSQKTGGLLALLALRSENSLTRPEITELLWPESELEAGQTSLRVALSSLRRQLEPPGSEAGSVLRADRLYLSLNPRAFKTDVSDFRREIAAAGRASDEDQAARHLEAAVEAYSGELLAGYHGDWIYSERRTLSDAYISALDRLAHHHARTRQWESAVELCWKGVAADPLRESFYRHLMRLYAGLKRPADAREVYALLERRLQELLGAAPSPAAREIARLLPTPGSALPGPTDKERSELSVPEAAADPQQNAAGAPGRLAAAHPKYRVPTQLNRFFGREEEAATLQSLVTSSLQTGAPPSQPACRLITLTGPGGVGKTRLAIHVGAATQESFAVGAAFVSLAHLTDARFLLTEIRDALGIVHGASDHVLDDIVQSLGSLPTLLILDNLEQIAEGAAGAIRELLTRAPALVCLATSRRSLGIAGESEWAVPPLSAPAEPAPVELAMESDSVQLFADRARAVQIDFRVTEENVAAVCALCARLDGMPLAIELAAARIRVLTPRQMLELLDDRFALLVDRRADKDSRHRSLRAAIDWSFQYLAPPARRLFIRLSVFRGGWTLETAAGVCGDGEAALDMIEPMEELTLDSLVRARAGKLGGRFDMLETLREFGARELRPLERGELNSRHADYFFETLERVATCSEELERRAAEEYIAAELDNLRQALTTLSGGSVSQRKRALAMANRMSDYWHERGAAREGRVWLEQCIAGAPTAPRTEVARAYLNAGRLANRQSDFEPARQLFNKSLDLFTRLGDPLAAADVRARLAYSHLMVSDLARSEALLTECLEAYRLVGDGSRTASTLSTLAGLHWNAGELDRARELYNESVRIADRLGSKRLRSTNILNLALLEQHSGNWEQARLFVPEALADAQASHAPHEIAFALHSLACLELHDGQYSESGAHLREGLRLVRQVGDHRLATILLGGLARLAIATGRPHRACKLGALVYQVQERYNCPSPPLPAKLAAHVLADLHTSLDPDTFNRLWAEGSAMSTDAGLEFALSDDD